MTDLVLQPTSTAQWHALVSEAEFASKCVLNEELESYLVFLLMRFANKPEMIAKVLALDYLDGNLKKGQSRKQRLREVGDQCLLFAGFFPKQAERRMVKVSYFVQIGQSAYQELADSANDESAKIYTSLAENFVMIMDILQTMRFLENEGSLSNLTPIHAFELWHETGSQHAYKIIRDFTDAHLVRTEMSCAEMATQEVILH